MANLFGDLIFSLARVLFMELMESFLLKAGRNFMLWADTRIRGRWSKVIIGGLLGLAGYFLLPILMSLFP